MPAKQPPLPLGPCAYCRASGIEPTKVGPIIGAPYTCTVCDGRKKAETFPSSCPWCRAPHTKHVPYYLPFMFECAPLGAASENGRQVDDEVRQILGGVRRIIISEEEK